MPNAELRTISLDEFQSGDYARKCAIARTFNQAMRRTGFFYLSGHGISEELVASTYAAAKEFFDRSEEYKRGFLEGGFGAKGYHPWGTERQAQAHTAEDSDDTSVDGMIADMVEDFMYSIHGGTDHEEYESRLPAEFKRILQNYTTQVAAVRQEFLKIASLALQLADADLTADDSELATTNESPSNEDLLKTNLFGEMFRKGGDGEMGHVHSLRINNYFDLSGVENATRGFRLGEHSDYAGFTVLNAEDVRGLQVKVDGQWFAVRPRANTFLVNAGLVIKMITNGYWHSSSHRVAATATERRTSLALFSAPDPETMIGPLRGCRVCSAEPFKYSRVSVREHIHHCFQTASNRGEDDDEAEETITIVGKMNRKL
uniref:Fe2OG dioxygenase domain-containing protein n=1 Tax=Lotharella globosa TaxID=91324 RepID=A0A7S3ZEI7_9EUKA